MSTTLEAIKEEKEQQEEYNKKISRSAYLFESVLRRFAHGFTPELLMQALEGIEVPRNETGDAIVQFAWLFWNEHLK